MKQTHSACLLLLLSIPAATLAYQNKPSTATALPAGDCVLVVHVSDSHQKAISGAHVAVSGKSRDGSFRLQESTDERGDARFAGLPRATVALSAEAHGKRVKKNVDTTSACESSLGVEIPN